MQSYGEYGNAALNAKVTALYQEIKNNLNILNNSDLRKELNALQGQLLSIVGKSYWSNPKIESIFRSIFRPHQIQIEEQYKTMEELLNDKTYQPPQIPKVSTAATTQAIKPSTRLANAIRSNEVTKNLQDRDQQANTLVADLQQPSYSRKQDTTDEHLANAITWALSNATPTEKSAICSKALSVMRNPTNILNSVKEIVQHLDTSDKVLASFLDTAFSKQPLMDRISEVIEKIKDNDTKAKYQIKESLTHLQQLSPAENETIFQKASTLVNGIHNGSLQQESKQIIQNKQLEFPDLREAAHKLQTDPSTMKKTYGDRLDTVLNYVIAYSLKQSPLNTKVLTNALLEMTDPEQIRNQAATIASKIDRPTADKIFCSCLDQALQTDFLSLYGGVISQLFDADVRMKYSIEADLFSIKTKPSDEAQKILTSVKVLCSMIKDENIKTACETRIQEATATTPQRRTPSPSVTPTTPMASSTPTPSPFEKIEEAIIQAKNANALNKCITDISSSSLSDSEKKDLLLAILEKNGEPDAYVLSYAQRKELLKQLVLAVDPKADITTDDNLKTAAKKAHRNYHTDRSGVTSDQARLYNELRTKLFPT